jgi:phage terminase small subunit
MAPRDHFRPSDMPLLEQYCQACLLARAAFEEITANGPVIDGKPSPWVAILAAAHKSSAALAARLRLAPQARATARTTGRNQNARAPSAFDLMRLEAEHSD